MRLHLVTVNQLNTMENIHVKLVANLFFGTILWLYATVNFKTSMTFEKLIFFVSDKHQ